MVARRIGPIHGLTVASPACIAAYGAPETPDQLLSQQALMQGTEAWQFLDGEKIVSVRPRGASRPTTARRWSRPPWRDWVSLICPMA